MIVERLSINGMIIGELGVESGRVSVEGIKRKDGMKLWELVEERGMEGESVRNFDDGIS